MDKPTEVFDLWPDVRMRTRVWWTRAALEGMAEYERTEQPKRGAFRRKVRYYAENGFDLFEGDKSPVRHRSAGVYRIGQKSTQFRVVGYYESARRDSFVVVEAELKDKDINAQINRVVRIREGGVCRK